MSEIIAGVGSGRRHVRCAIYTRKSSEDGLEQEFNSLDAQREACEAYIASQRHEGWVVLPDRYDDGGLSGGTLERPALQRLMESIDDGLVDQVVVYKSDRLTRSLADFAKLVERLDQADASFVSVTQSFNTATSMGRLTLNVLLSFAQFEREVTAERIREKIAASNKKCLWMGGSVALGYKPNGRTLIEEPTNANIVRSIYDLYERCGTLTDTHTELRNQKAKGRKPWSDQPDHRIKRSGIRALLTNPIYAGRIRHKSNVYDGQHAPLIAPQRRDKIQQQLNRNAQGKKRPSTTSANAKANPTSSPLHGKLYGNQGHRLTPHHTKRGQKRYRYYVSTSLLTKGDREHQTQRSTATTSKHWRLPADALENSLAQSIVRQLRKEIPRQLGEQLSASHLQSVLTKLEALDGACKQLDVSAMHDVLGWVAKAKLSDNTIQIILAPKVVAAALCIAADHLPKNNIQWTEHLAFKRRGVEAKLVLGDDRTVNVDTVLLSNIARANQWYAAIKDGVSSADLSEQTGISKQRLSRVINLAFLSPTIVAMIARGDQPISLTSEYLLRRPIPSDRRKQEEMVNRL